MMAGQKPPRSGTDAGFEAVEPSVLVFIDAMVRSMRPASRESGSFPPERGVESTVKV